MIEYTLVRKKRRTMSLIVRADGGLEVRAPLRTPRDTIDRFVLDHRAWIEARLQRRATLLPFTQPTDTLLPLLGHDREVVSLTTQGNRAHFDGEHFILPEAPDERRCAADKLYRQLAREHFAPLLDTLSRELSLPYSSLRISGARTRWGSCGQDGRISLSWRLVALPPQTIRYVIIHELCHTKHRNHGRVFYDMLYALCPDHRDRDDDLRRWAVRLGACYGIIAQP